MPPQLTEPPNVPVPGLLWLQCNQEMMMQCFNAKTKFRRRQPAWDDHVGNEHKPNHANSQRDLPRMNNRSFGASVPLISVGLVEG
jgi:hypothetical protein